MLDTCTVETFDFKKFAAIKVAKKKKGNPGTKSKARYLDVVAAFDIETSNLPGTDHAFMYIWQLKIEGFPTVIGHYWTEFLSFVKALKVTTNNDDLRLVVWVHNLSFEFQFLSGVYKFKPEEVFAVEKRKVLRAEMYSYIELRCSYIHSNMGLDKFTKAMNVEHQKLSGEEFDYSKVRYPWSEMTERELEYCVNDVLGLVEAIRAEMTFDHDNLYSIPMTSTGYVRRDAKYAMRKASHKMVDEMRPDWELYSMLREAFRGGNTHANRCYAGMFLENVTSVDIASSYPTVLCCCEYPLGKFKHSGPLDSASYVNLLQKHKAVIMRVAFHNVRLKNPLWGCPYLARSKCFMVRGGWFDNGRIMQADYLETTLTDIDFSIVLSEYDADDIIIYDSYYARYGFLPDAFVGVIRDYFKKKTELKHDKTPDGQYMYMKSKNKLNSLYGMTAQDPVKRSIIYEDMEFTIDEGEQPWDILAESNKRMFLPYAWGVWTTAHARMRLEEGLRIAGNDFVYCDTDSVKMLQFDDVKRAAFDEFNAKREYEAVSHGAYATDSLGVTYHMGVYENDGVYRRFSTLGAKKYVYQYEDGVTHVTIAGVNKAKGGKELDAANGIYSFSEGFIFTEAGGTESIYNDLREPLKFEVDGHTLDVTANVKIKESTYTLGITDEYRRILACPDLDELIDYGTRFVIK